MTKIVLEFDSMDELGIFVSEFSSSRDTSHQGLSLEEQSDLLYGGEEHYSESKGTYFCMEDMNPVYILNVLAKKAKTLKRGEEIPLEVRALAYHLWKNIAIEDEEESEDEE